MAVPSRKILVLICACLILLVSVAWSWTGALTSVANVGSTDTYKTQTTHEILKEKQFAALLPKTMPSLRERRFTPSENEHVFILGAVVKNSTPNAIWDRVAFYGQWYDQRSVDVLHLKCCFKFGNGSVAQTKLLDHMVRGYPAQLEEAPLVNWHITCASPNSGRVLVSIARYSSCDNTSLSYIKPYYAMKEWDGYTVITTKLAYNQVFPEIVIGFLEAVKFLGVNKVITYVVDNLDSNIKAILRYYAHSGFLEYNAIELADNKRTPHKQILNSTVLNATLYMPQYRNDEWIVMRDALERNYGASYFGIFDMDEYLIPSGGRSIPRLLNDLRNKHPLASHFFFKNVHFLTDRSTCKTRDPNCSLFHRHLMTSPIRFNNIHRKMFLMPSRVETKNISNHNVTSEAGFRGVNCTEIEAYVRHYGICERKFNFTDGIFICNTTGRWVKDTSMVDWAERTILNNVRNVLTLFGL